MQLRWGTRGPSPNPKRNLEGLGDPRRVMGRRRGPGTPPPAREVRTLEPVQGIVARRSEGVLVPLGRMTWRPSSFKPPQRSTSVDESTQSIEALWVRVIEVAPSRAKVPIPIRPISFWIARPPAHTSCSQIVYLGGTQAPKTRGPPRCGPDVRTAAHHSCGVSRHDQCCRRRKVRINTEQPGNGRSHGRREA